MKNLLFCLFVIKYILFFIFYLYIKTYILVFYKYYFVERETKITLVNSLLGTNFKTNRFESETKGIQISKSKNPIIPKFKNITLIDS